VNYHEVNPALLVAAPNTGRYASRMLGHRTTALSPWTRAELKSPVARFTFIAFGAVVLACGSGSGDEFDDSPRNPATGGAAGAATGGSSGSATGGDAGVAGSGTGGNAAMAGMATGGSGAVGGSGAEAGSGGAGAGGTGISGAGSGGVATNPPPGMYGTRAMLPAANSEMAVAETNGKIYVLGGYPSSGESVTTVQVYDVATDTWAMAAPLPEPLHHPVAVGVAGKIYSLGGQIGRTASVDTTLRRKQREPALPSLPAHDVLRLGRGRAIPV